MQNQADLQGVFDSMSEESFEKIQQRAGDPTAEDAMKYVRIENRKDYGPYAPKYEAQYLINSHPNKVIKATIKTFWKCGLSSSTNTAPWKLVPGDEKYIGQTAVEYSGSISTYERTIVAAWFVADS